MTGVFEDIYTRNHWGNPESRSGSGSTIRATLNLRRMLPGILRGFDITSVLDIPCGDFNWMQYVDLGCVKYIGADISPSAIENNIEAHGRKGYDFLVLDVVNDPLPLVDLVICRDCLVHLPTAKAFAALENICSSGAQYLLTTTFPFHDNFECDEGEWRPINLNMEPFPLPPPLLLLNEGCIEAGLQDKSIALWQIQN